MCQIQQINISIPFVSRDREIAKLEKYCRNVLILKYIENPEFTTFCVNNNFPCFFQE